MGATLKCKQFSCDLADDKEKNWGPLNVPPSLTEFETLEGAIKERCWFWKYQYQCQYRYQYQEWERRETRGKRPRPPPSRLIEFVCTRVKIKINDYSTMLKPAAPPSSAPRHLVYNPGPAFAEGSPPEVYLLPQPDRKIALGCPSNTSSPKNIIFSICILDAEWLVIIQSHWVTKRYPNCAVQLTCGICLHWSQWSIRPDTLFHESESFLNNSILWEKANLVIKWPTTVSKGGPGRYWLKLLTFT